MMKPKTAKNYKQHPKKFNRNILCDEKCCICGKNAYCFIETKTYCLKHKPIDKKTKLERGFGKR